MPTLIFALLLAVLVFATPVAMSPMTVVNAVAPPPTTITSHYVRNGVVQFNTATNASRFIPYRLAKEFDRRRATGEMA